MQYEPVDRLPVLALEPYEVPVLERWWQEGIPPGQSPEQFLGMDLLRKFPVTLTPLPPFEQKILSETEEAYVETDSFGATVRRRKDFPTMYYGYIDHPVKNMNDWLRYKERYVATSPGRLPAGMQGVIRDFSASEDPVGFDLFPFFFRQGFYLMGMQRFMTAFYDMPELIHDMFSFWSAFVIEVIRPLLREVKLDFVTFTEDLAYKGGPHISPRVYEEFWLPYQDPVVEVLRASGIPVICMWSAGNLLPLLPTLLEHGFNCTWPIERGAGMDPFELRHRFGRGLRLAGGVAKEALIAGPDAIDREIERLLPLIREGGFLPAIDDMVPPEVPLDHYRYYVNAMQAVKL